MNYSQVKHLYDEKGFIFDTRKYGANLFGRRSKDLATVNKFNDVIGVAYVDAFGQGQCLEFEGSTKPGLSYLNGKPFNQEGTFIMTPGQHLNAWFVGFHHAGDALKQYEAFQQRAAGVFKGWRDNNQDGKFDFVGKIYTNGAGVNGHRAGINETENVGLYGAGCQVVRDDKEFLIWLSVGKRSAELYGNSLNYTLFQDV